jgi:hypothetical protein
VVGYGEVMHKRCLSDFRVAAGSLYVLLLFVSVLRQAASDTQFRQWAIS